MSAVAIRFFRRVGGRRDTGWSWFVLVHACAFCAVRAGVPWDGRGCCLDELGRVGRRAPPTSGHRPWTFRPVRPVKSRAPAASGAVGSPAPDGCPGSGPPCAAPPGNGLVPLIHGGVSPVIASTPCLASRRPSRRAGPEGANGSGAGVSAGRPAGRCRLSDDLVWTEFSDKCRKRRPYVISGSWLPLHRNAAV